MNTPSSKKQISFRIDAQIADEMKAAAAEDGIHELGPFTRELVEWAFGYRKKATALFLLKKAKVQFPQLKVK